MPKKQNNFSERVRTVVRTIERGRTMTYKEVAIQAGKKDAARAVANVMAKNYDPTVPCHRVIRTDGTLGGYNRGGTSAKRILLRNEGVHI
jgi:methylated-DNA-[protein]-cysteine S-methyltransferase